jgi:hypothetical protein
VEQELQEEYQVQMVILLHFLELHQQVEVVEDQIKHLQDLLDNQEDQVVEEQEILVLMKVVLEIVLQQVHHKEIMVVMV